jgi:hypothetical protein
VNATQRGSPDSGPTVAPALDERLAPRRRRTMLALHGAVSAAALGVYTVVGAVGAFLALFPASLRPVPRGRSGEARAPAPSAEASREPLAG